MILDADGRPVRASIGFTSRLIREIPTAHGLLDSVISNAFAVRDFWEPLILDQYGRPLPSALPRPKIGAPITLQRPVRFREVPEQNRIDILPSFSEPR